MWCSEEEVCEVEVFDFHGETHFRRPDGHVLIARRGTLWKTREEAERAHARHWVDWYTLKISETNTEIRECDESLAEIMAERNELVAQRADYETALAKAREGLA